MRILIIDDDPRLLDDLPRRLRADGHRVAVGPATGDLLERVVAEGIHLVVLDAALLSDRRLLDFCRALRQESSALLLLLDCHDSVTRRIQALDAGADDFLAQPVGHDEVRAHVHALLRRHPLATLAGGLQSVRVTAVLTLDLVGQRLVGERTTIPLTDREFRLLVYLVRNEGAVLSREALLNAVWGDDDAISDREVDVYVRYLRRKIEPDPAHPRYLLTVWGRGYRYQGLPPAQHGRYRDLRKL